MCLCCSTMKLIYHFSFPTIGLVCHNSALAWSYTRGRGVLYITSTVVKKRVAIGGRGGRIESSQATSLRRAVRTYKMSGLLRLDIHRGQKEIVIPAPARPPTVVVVSTRNERRMRESYSSGNNFSYVFCLQKIHFGHSRRKSWRRVMRTEILVTRTVLSREAMVILR